MSNINCIQQIRERFESELQHLRSLLDAHKELDELRHTEEDKAREFAVRNLDRRLDEMNEFRRQILEERGLFVHRELHDRLEHDVDTRLKLLENIKSNLEGRIWMMGAAISVVLVLVQLLIYFIEFRSGTIPNIAK